MGYRKIKLTRGKYAIVDTSDFLVLNSFKWCASQRRKTFIAVRRSSKKDGNKILLMHRVLMRVTNPLIQVDHKNKNTLDNRKRNLRVCNNSQNNCNVGVRRSNKLGVKGVYYDSVRKRYIPEIMVNYKKIYLGRFKDLSKAKEVYIAAAKKYHREFARWK